MLLNLRDVGGHVTDSGARVRTGVLYRADAPIYLSNPYVVAASALTGMITDPQEFLS